jgi:hypothetical protein
MDNKKKEKKQEVNKTSDGFTPPPKVLTNDNIDINSKELGSFENVDTSGLEEFVEEAKKNDKKNIKIDFERFEKKKKQEKNN